MSEPLGPVIALPVVEALRPSQQPPGMPIWTTETQEAVKRIGEIIKGDAPEWVWAPWSFVPTREQIDTAIVEAGRGTINENAVVTAEPEALAAIQTIQWDAHCEELALEHRRVVGSPIVVVGTPYAEQIGEAIADALIGHFEKWRVLETAMGAGAAEASGAVEAAGAVAAPTLQPAQPSAQPSYPAWACGNCGWVARGTIEEPIPTTVCRQCGQSSSWRQPTTDELAQVSPAERQSVQASPTWGWAQEALRREVAQAQEAARHAVAYSQPGGPIPRSVAGIPAYEIPREPGQNFIAQSPLGPDPETSALVDIVYILSQLDEAARVRVWRYIKDRF